MLIVIDGTGDANNDVYNSDMQNGFLHQIINSSDDPVKHYFRGPTLLGTEVNSIASAVINVLTPNVCSIADSEREIFLAGYSRGGAVCVAVANRLKRNYLTADFKINCMALFDAVDRSLEPDTTIIPDNVEMAYHAMRDSSIESRWYFGNCGTSHVSPRKLIKKEFKCTHAGMGGVPWTGDHPSECNTFMETIQEEVRVGYRFGETSVVVSDSLQRYDVRDAYQSFVTGSHSIAHFCSPTITGQDDRSNSALVKSWMWDNMRRHGMVR